MGSWETTKSHLEHLVEMGRLRTVDVDGEPRYEPDPVRDYLDHIGELVVENTKAELRDELEAIAAEIEDWKETYAVDSRTELEATLGAAKIDPDDVRDRRWVLEYWEENDQYRRRISHALRLYDDLSAQGPGSDPVTA